MNMRTPAENRLRQHRLHIGAAPILSPSIKKVKLAIPQENSTFYINALRIVLRILDMVRTRILLGNQPQRPRFKLAVLYNSEADTAYV